MIKSDLKKKLSPGLFAAHSGSRRGRVVRRERRSKINYCSSMRFSFFRNILTEELCCIDIDKLTLRYYET